MTDKLTTPILTSAARTASGQSGAFAVGSGSVAVLLNVTAVSGTSPSMTVSVEWSNDGTNWFVADTADAFTAITAGAAVTKVFAVKGMVARLNYAISGTTPSFTFTADAVTGV